MLRRFKRNAKGAVLIEFGLSAVILVVVLLGTIEFGVEMFARNTTERLTNRAGEVYALTRDISKVDDVFENKADSITRRCLKPVEISLFDEVSSQSIFDQEGRPAVGLASDETAVAFRLMVICEWPRLTPALGGLLGSVGGHRASVVMRFRE